MADEAEVRIKSRSEIGMERSILNLQNQVKKLTLNTGKKYITSILKYITRNMYLEFTRTSTSGSSLLLSYLHYMDRKHIRKYHHMYGKFGVNPFDYSIKTGRNVSRATFPDTSNIVSLGNYTYLYYNINLDRTSGELTVYTYFIGPNMYKERHNMFMFFDRYLAFRSKKRKATPLKKIKVSKYSDSSNQRKYIPAKSDKDIISKNKEELISSILKWDSESIIKWYADHNLIHKYCALLFGPPGTGKTSMIIYIASILKRNIYTMDLSVKLEDLKEISLDNNKIDSSIIIIEDIDISLNLDGKSDSQKQAIEDKIQWLMQVLDGTESIENAIIIITTNKIDKIDNRLLRKGRIDKKIEIGYFDRDEMKEMCNNFNVDINDIVPEDKNSIQPVELHSLIREHLFETIQKDL